jgi:hypothetical protein
LASAARAGVVVYSDIDDVFKDKYDLKVATDDGSQIVGFDFASKPEYGISGNFSQIQPAGLPTVFADDLFGFHTADDTQFKFNRSGVLIGPPGTVFESDTQLRANFTLLTPLDSRAPFAQIATHGNPFVDLQGEITTLKNGNETKNRVTGVCVWSCYAPSFGPAIYFVDDANNPGYVNHTIAPGFELSNFRLHRFLPAFNQTGNAPAVPATFDFATRTFHWDTAGSPWGYYEWRLTASNMFGSNDDSIVVRLVVPEPRIFHLLGVLTLVVFRFRYGHARPSFGS